MKYSEGNIPWVRGKTKERYPQLSNGGNKKGYTPWNKGKKGVQVAWNKGLTKMMDPRIKCNRKGCHHTQETKNTIATKCRERSLELWQDPVYAKKVLHRRTPSGPEKTFMGVGTQYRFVGNGQLVIGGKNPDFISIKDDYKLIEIWGEHFKLGRNPQDLIDFYKVRGYDCLVIWASELKHPEQVLVRIQEFEGR